ncbi:MAG: indole-3-glycerol phosphate synthase TrpC [Spirochaetaceae bacterium]|jgi:indole-3-glycerol phosphate synthase|nr:indole-3-glycerol phosphate synthase TrpC [Spirochaetaceae bacterium]
MILDKIAASTRERLATLKVQAAFEDALKTPGLSFICEVKKASPSKGVIAEDFPYRRIAREYEAAGAAAISVLTEPQFFQGSAAYLQDIARDVQIPCLRKDFVIDEYQIYEAKFLGAAAVLLICALLDEKQLAAFIRIAESIGLSALVETHCESEVESAVNAGARIIGVNNRDLQTFAVDLDVTRRLAKRIPDGLVKVSESGIHTSDDIKRVNDCGVDAVLIGESMMRAQDKKRYLQELAGKK